MVAFYDSLLATAKDRMRHMLGDTDMAAPLREDETYEAILTAYGETMGTAVLAEALAVEYAQQPTSVSASGVSVAWPDRVKTWQELAKRLRTTELEVARTNALHLLGSGRPQRSDDDLGTTGEYAIEREPWWNDEGRYYRG